MHWNWGGVQHTRNSFISNNKMPTSKTRGLLTRAWLFGGGCWAGPRNEHVQNGPHLECNSQSNAWSAVRICHSAQWYLAIPHWWRGLGGSKAPDNWRGGRSHWRSSGYPRRNKVMGTGTQGHVSECASSAVCPANTFLEAAVESLLLLLSIGYLINPSYSLMAPFRNMEGAANANLLKTYAARNCSFQTFHV